MDTNNSQVLEFSEITNDIKISVIPEFNNEGSNSEQNIFVWIYTIRIENLGNSAIQVISIIGKFLIQMEELKKLKAMA